LATSSAAPTNASDLNWIDKTTQATYDALSCRKSATSIVADFRQPGQVDDPTKPLVTCNKEGSIKFVLGPVELSGTDISDATAGTTSTSTGASTNEWAVNLNFKPEGATKFGKITQRLYPLTSPRNQFAVTLDGYVITAPQTNAVITNGSAQITGGLHQRIQRRFRTSLSMVRFQLDLRFRAKRTSPPPWDRLSWQMACWPVQSVCCS